jgi:tripartite-type tricarboxylate transporter receptor subunit TctC
VVQRLNAATVKAINDEKLQQKLVQQGVVTIGSTPAELRDYTARESSRWGKIIDERHITVK